MMTLTYDVTTVAIRQPELGDTTTLDSPRKRVQAVDGTLMVSEANGQSSVKTYEFDSLGICDTDIALFETFINNTVGLPIEVTTYEGTFTGFIINVDIEIIEGRVNENRVSLQLLVETIRIRAAGPNAAIDAGGGNYIWLR